MFIPGDFGRPPPTAQMSKNITTTFLGSSLYPVMTVDSNSMFKVKREEFQFDTGDGTYFPDIALKIPRTPLLVTDPSTYISVSPFTESNIRKYHSSAGNLNHENIKNPLSLEDIKASYKPDQLPLGSAVNPLMSDFFKPVHLTPGCIAEIVFFNNETSAPFERSNTISQRNKMKLWGAGRKNEETTAALTVNPDLKPPKSSLSRSSSTFITKVSTTDGLTKKLNAVDGLMVSAHGRFLNVINLNDDYTKIEIDVPYLRVLFTVGVITAIATFVSPKGQEKNLDIAVGFSSGDIVWLSPFKMKYSRFNKNAKLSNKPIISLSWSPCGRFIYSGFSDGEIMIFNRDLDDDDAYNPTGPIRRVQHAKYFRDLSSKAELNPLRHLQVSHKPITSIKFHPVITNLCCITSDDGFLKLMDISTLSITDIFPSYYGGFLCCEFSNDGKYLFVGGEDDFVSVYEVGSQANAGNLRLITRLEGACSWVRSIKIDYFKSEKNVIYRVGAVGDDGMLTLWEFQPANLPKIKISLHHRTRSSQSPNLKTLNNGVFQPQRNGSHRRKVSASLNGMTPMTRHRHSNSVSSLTSAHQQQQQMSIAQAMNSQSQLSLANLTSINMEIKNSIASKQSVSKEIAPTGTCTVHEFAALTSVPILKPILSHDFKLGKLSGVSFNKNFIWIITCGGDSLRWTRPKMEKNIYVKDYT